MRRSSSLSAAALVVALTLFAVLAAGAVRTDRAGAQGDVHVVWPISSVKTTFLDFESDGLRLGDRLASRGPLLDATQTNQAGSAYLECVVMRSITDGHGLYRCSYLLKLADGTILLEGLDPRGPGTATFAVMGGTGAYRDATGEATLTDTLSETDLVIELVT